MLIRVNTFKGAFPRFSARLLDQSAAQSALNCRLKSGALEAWRSLEPAAGGPWLSGAKQAIYRWKGQWFHWLDDVDVVRSPIANNVNDRVIFTGHGVPKITDDSIAAAGTYLPAASYDLGIAAPSSVPAVSAGAVPPDSAEENRQGRNYVFTYVSAWGEEGPPSEASVTLEVVDGQPVTVAGLSALGGSYAGPGTKRIYRANSGTQSTEFQFVAEIPMAQTSYEDSVAGEDLGEALQSLNFDPPPADLAGLTVMPNGMLVGFSGNDLCFSEPYQPHAWPTDYRLSTDWPIVAVGVMGNSVLVATEGAAYIANGIDPQAMTLRKLPIPQACVAKRGLVEVPQGVLYPSPDGLVLASEGGIQVLTGALMTRADWQAYAPQSLHAVYHDGAYYGFYDTGTEQGCVVLDADASGITTTDVHCDAAYVDPLDDTLYLLDGDDLYQWDRGAGSLTYVWRSKLFEVPRPTNFKFSHVVADAYPVTLRVYADEALVHSATVADDRPLTLPGGFLARAWAVELEGSVRVHSVSLAQSAAELRQA